jgi:DNA-binding LacI/PurR family transcriptional regulator
LPLDIAKGMDCSESQIMENVPRRYSLVAQVGDILQTEIECGVLRGVLPSELELAKRFQVSRPTIRGSLEILRKAGLIESIRGQNHRILPQTGKARVEKEDEGIIILGFAPLEELSPFSLALISQVQQVAGSKFNVQIVCSASPSPLPKIKEIAAKHRYRCWVVIGPSADVLRWFEASHLPCLALAPAIPSSEIPVLAMDMNSVMSHAFALAGQRGYSGPLLILPSSRSADDTSRTFLSIQAKHGKTEAAVFLHDSTMEGIRKAVDRIAKSRIIKGEPPPLILVVRPKFALMALTYLREKNYKHGIQFGLISIGRENYLDFCVPTMACYTINRQRMFKKFLRMLSEILDSGYTRPGLFRIIADFIDGETLPRLSAKE